MKNLKNKAKFLSFALMLICAGNLGSFAAQSATPEERAKSFYRWYIKEITLNPAAVNKKETMKYVSKRLGKWYFSPAYEEYGADYFIDAQDFDENWVPTTTKAVINGNTATLKVMLAAPKGGKSLFKQNLALKMTKENGVWKIDSVNNRKLTTD